MLTQRKPHAYVEVFEFGRSEPSDWRKSYASALAVEGFVTIAYFPVASTRSTSLPHEILSGLSSIERVAIGGNAELMGFEARDPELLRLSGASLAGAVQLDGSALEYFSIADGSFSSRCDRRHRRQEFEEWTIGACLEPFEVVPGRPGWFRVIETFTVEYFVQQHQRLVYASTIFGESGEGVVITRRQSEISQILDELSEIPGFSHIADRAPAPRGTWR